MGEQYTVQAGDSLSKIARSHGYASWRVIYYHPDNAGFRRRRPDPNLIQPRDVLILPDPPSSAAPSARLILPWNFASQLGIPTRIPLDPLTAPDLTSIGPRLFPPSRPSFMLRPPPSGPSGSTGVTMGGAVLDTPLTLTGEPVHGGYTEALKYSGRAILKYPFVRERVDAAKDWALDIAWRSAPGWRRGLEIGLALGGASVLLGIRPTREFIRETAHGQDIPLSLIGIDWLSIQPRLGIDGDWGGVFTFDLQNVINPPARR